MGTPAISVIMPLYNKRPYVAQSINSLLSQELTDWELVVVDDGSTDGSPELIPADPRIQLIRQENAGPSAARNRALQLARAPWVALLDADDTFEPGRLGATLTGLEASGAEWGLCAHWHQSGAERRYRALRNHANQPMVGSHTATDALRQLWLRGVPSGCITVRTELMERLGGFDASLRCYEITHLIVRLALRRPTVWADSTPLYRVITVPNSAFSASEHRVQGATQAAHRYLALAARHPDRRQALERRAEAHLRFAAKALLRQGKPRQARELLTLDYPLRRDKRWLLLRLASQLPTEVLEAALTAAGKE